MRCILRDLIFLTLDGAPIGTYCGKTFSWASLAHLNSTQTTYEISQGIHWQFLFIFKWRVPSTIPLLLCASETFKSEDGLFIGKLFFPSIYLFTLGEMSLFWPNPCFLWHLTITKTIKMNVKNEKLSFLDSQTYEEDFNFNFQCNTVSLIGGAAIRKLQNQRQNMLHLL